MDGTPILVASEAMAASKQPRRSDLTSKFNSLTSITYVPSLASKGLHELNGTHKEVYDPLTCVASPQVKILTLAFRQTSHRHFFVLFWKQL